MQVKYVAFAIGESCSFVETRRIDQVISGKRNLQGLFAGCTLQLLAHVCPSKIRTFMVIS